MIKNLILVGCGHMGYAMLRRWVESKAASTIKVITPHLESLHGLEKQGVQYIQFPTGLAEGDKPDVIVFAVTPQILPDILKGYAQVKECLFISIAAGKTLDFYGKHLGGTARVIRAMPNLPAKVGAGATLLVRNTFCTRADSAHAETLLAGLGTVSWLEREEQMDAATALSGCGPAYYYLLTDVLAKVGVEMGLPLELATNLAKQTMLGSAALWREEDKSAETLYKNIAVKGGMTEAALSVLLKQEAMKHLMKEALRAAVTHAKTLAK